MHYGIPDEPIMMMRQPMQVRARLGPEGGCGRRHNLLGLAQAVAVTVRLVTPGPSRDRASAAAGGQNGSRPMGLRVWSTNESPGSHWAWARTSGGPTDTVAGPSKT